MNEPKHGDNSKHPAAEVLRAGAGHEEETAEDRRSVG